MEAADIAGQNSRDGEQPGSIPEESGSLSRQGLQIRRVGDFFRDDGPAAQQSQMVLAAVRDDPRDGDAHAGEVGQIEIFAKRPIPAECLAKMFAPGTVPLDVVIPAACTPFDDVAEDACRYLGTAELEDAIQARKIPSHRRIPRPHIHAPLCGINYESHA
jgi:hypothetical protein